MKRPYRSFVLLFLFFFLTLHPMEEIHAAPPDYLKSVTYFSDAWPINFWSTESPNLDAELQQIVDDGFNKEISNYKTCGTESSLIWCRIGI
ncbi:MAG: hypothetical protein RR995_05945 [Hungatella sp.]